MDDRINDQKEIGGGIVWRETRLGDARNAKARTVTMSARYARSAGLGPLRCVRIAHLARRWVVDPSVRMSDEKKVNR
jgi:hypothetical protein